MQRLENRSLQIFLDSFIKELKNENESRKAGRVTELDIPFIVSTLYQCFANKSDEFKDFIEDLKVYPHYNILISDSKNDYSGIIDVEIILCKYKSSGFEQWNMDECTQSNYNYRLYFTYESRDYGFCECTPDMPDYREDKNCCGHGCDAEFCEFSLHKILHIASGSWDGDKHDYWDFEDEFYLSDKELAEKKEKEDREREIEELKSRIETDQKRLAELEGV